MPVRSAGILLWRRVASAPSGVGSLEVYIAHMGGPFWARKDARAWSLPKGEYDPAEQPLDAARREFAEEIGTPPPDAAYLSLGDVRYSSGKTVAVFAVEAPHFEPATVVSNTFEIEWPPRSGRTQTFPEVDAAGWVAIDEAREKLVAGQVAALDRLVTALGASGGAG